MLSRGSWLYSICFPAAVDAAHPCGAAWRPSVYAALRLAPPAFPGFHATTAALPAFIEWLRWLSPLRSGSHLHAHYPCSTYCHQPPKTRRHTHHVQGVMVPAGTPLALSAEGLRRSLVGSSTFSAKSCSLALRSIELSSRCSPPHLAVTQFRLSYLLFSWVSNAGSPTRQGCAA